MDQTSLLKGGITMTNNQISFLNYQETNRSNLARERETQRSNLAREGETHRSNIVVEGETQRSNLAKESEMRRSNLAKESETHRTNVVNEQIDIGKLHETHRVNTEQRRHNLASETLSSTQNAIAKERNDIDRYVAELRNAMDSSRLAFDQQKEAQRIIESLRDYQLALGKTMVSGFNGSTLPGLNAARSAASAAVGAGLGTSLATRTGGGSFGVDQARIAGSAAGGGIAGVLRRISKAPLLLWFRNLGDLKPNYSNEPYHYTAGDIM